jgi:hypothetical protein
LVVDERILGLSFEPGTIRNNWDLIGRLTNEQNEFGWFATVAQDNPHTPAVFLHTPNRPGSVGSYYVLKTNTSGLIRNAMFEQISAAELRPLISQACANSPNVPWVIGCRSFYNAPDIAQVWGEPFMVTSALDRMTFGTDPFSPAETDITLVRPVRGSASGFLATRLVNTHDTFGNVERLRSHPLGAALLQLESHKPVPGHVYPLQAGTSEGRLHRLESVLGEATTAPALAPANFIVDARIVGDQPTVRLSRGWLNKIHPNLRPSLWQRFTRGVGAGFSKIGAGISYGLSYCGEAFCNLNLRVANTFGRVMPVVAPPLRAMGEMKRADTLVTVGNAAALGYLVKEVNDDRQDIIDGLAGDPLGVENVDGHLDEPRRRLLEILSDRVFDGAMRGPSSLDILLP